VMEKLEGRVLWPVLDGASSYEANDLLEQFGRLLAQLHRLDWRPFTEQAALYEANPAGILDELLASLRQLYTQFDVRGFLAIVDWLESHKTMAEVQPSVVHLDFHPTNVFLGDDGRLSVIDWSQISVSDYRADLTWTLMIMGEFGRPQWAEQILQAYQATAVQPVMNLDYFNVLSYTKLLGSTVISLRESPEKLGLRAETAESVAAQLPVLKALAKELHNITGLTIPEVEAVFRQIG
jgi:aminoglycoside phosphotransferase (APT) family kinase protein